MDDNMLEEVAIEEELDEEEVYEDVEEYNRVPEPRATAETYTPVPEQIEIMYYVLPGSNRYTIEVNTNCFMHGLQLEKLSVPLESIDEELNKIKVKYNKKTALKMIY